MIIDFSKAFLYGNTNREVYIELSDEDGRKQDSDCAGVPRKSMYGLRDAPQIWQEVVQDMLKARGYVSLVCTQCMYTNPSNGMLIVAHVDDFLALGVVSNVLDQYAGHLVRNAIDHGLESAEERQAAGKTSVGHVWLEVSIPEDDAADDRVELVFCDDGRGIDLEKVRRLAQKKGVVSEDWIPESDAEVLDLLFKSGFSTKDVVSEISGRGVGLDAVRSAVRAFGGDVTLRNRTRGPGSEAVFKIPRSLVRFRELGGQLLGVNGTGDAANVAGPVVDLAAPSRKEQIVSGKKKKILIVDDQPVFRGNLASSIREDVLGDYLEPIEAENGLEALNLVKAHDDIVVAVVDVHMPVMKGTDFIRSFRHECPEQFNETLTFMMTTEGDPELRQEFKELGLAGWIVKPVDPEFFVRALSKKFIPNNPQPFAKAVGE